MSDDLIHEAALLYILKGKSSSLSWSTFTGFVDCAKVRSLLLSSASDVILQRCMLSPPFPKVGYSEKCIVLLRGTFSLWASSHLIKQAQEMSLLADWPCVFLRRPPTGTIDMHNVSLWQRTHLTYVSLWTATLTFSSPLSFPLTPIYSTSALFSQREMITISFILHLASSLCQLPLVLSSPPPFSLQPLVFLT